MCIRDRPRAQPIDPQTIEGKRKHEKTKEKGDYFYRELAYGKFSRTMTLPAGVKADNMKATCKDGVLRLPCRPQRRWFRNAFRWKPSRGYRIALLPRAGKGDECFPSPPFPASFSPPQGISIIPTSRNPHASPSQTCETGWRRQPKISGPPSARILLGGR